MEEQYLLSKIRLLPNELKQEIMDFVEFLLNKYQGSPEPQKQPQFGSAKGVFQMSPDFDDPLEDFTEYMK